MKIAPDSTLSERKGVGEDAGYLLLSADDPDSLLHDVDHIDKRLQFVME